MHVHVYTLTSYTGYLMHMIVHTCSYIYGCARQCVCVCVIYIDIYAIWILFCTFSGDTIANGGGDWNPNNDTSYTTANGQTDKT